MWIVRFALKRPYTFVIVAVLIAIFGVASIVTTPTDILPDIAIPIVSVIWTYSGLDADDMSKRIIGVCERALPTTVNNIQYTESQSYSGVGVIKIHFQPNVQIDLAIAQVTALAQSLLRLMPTGILPPYVLKYDASSVPIVQVSLGGQGLSQTELYDLGQNFVRGQLATINGAAVPLPYGGKQRSIMVDVEPVQLAANHLTASDLSLALSKQNLVTPSGTEKIGDREYLVGTNSSPGTIAELNALPIRTVNGAVVQMKDVAWIHNGYQPQTSYVSENGQASALLTVIKSGASSTLTIVDQVKSALPRIKAGLPSALTLTPIFDQSVLVRASIRDVVQEAITAAFLTALMVLVFLGSWRSTLIVSVSIPLACLFAIAASSALGETINVMSLGGLALAVGMLVDDATVEIENTHRNLGLEQKKPLASAILDSAEQVAVPALISTMSICIVFVPVTLLSGSAKYIFTPLALNVVLALVASYALSRTLVPTMMHFLLPKEAPLYQGQEAESPLSQSFIWRFHQKFEHGFDQFAEKYKGGLEWVLEHRAATLAVFAVVALFVGVDPGNRPGLFSVRGLGADGVSCAATGGDADRDGYSGVQAGERGDSACHSAGAAPDDRQQHRAATGGRKPGLLGERYDEQWRWGCAGAARGQAPPDAGVDEDPAAGFRAEISPGDLLFRTGRYHQSNAELRAARADRCAGTGKGRSDNGANGRNAAGANQECSRRSGCVYAAGRQRAEAEHQSGPTEGAGARADGERCL
jgi:multidrug efflux pump subunit AcrB